MSDDLLPELGDLVFSVLIGYAGALQFLYVVRHLYHWSCGHMATTQNDGESLKRLQERMRSELAEAEAKELQAGTQVMKDGLLYKDGFRTDAEQLKNDRLIAEQSTPEAREKRKKEIESELKRQKEIEETTRTQLAEAEAQLEQQRKQAAEELAARQQAEEERAKEAEQEEARKLLEREQMREEEERRREVEEEARRKREAEEEARKAAEEEAARKRAEEEQIKRQEQEEARRAAEEEAKRKRAAEEEEKSRFEEQARKAAEEEMAQKLAEEEAQRSREVEALKVAEENAAREAEEQSRKLLEAERQREHEQRKREIEEEAEIARKLAEANEVQRRLEENASREAEEQSRKLLEAERQRDHEQRKREVEEEAEMARNIAEENEVQRRLEENATRETEEQSRKLLEAERQHEHEQRKREAEEEAIGREIEKTGQTNNREIENDAENEKELFEIERLHEEEQREQDMEEAQNEGESESAPDEGEEEIEFNRIFTNEALASKKQNEMGEAETLDSIMQLLDAESNRQMREKEFEETVARERGEKQRLIEENARKFLEADQEMEQLLESVQKQRRLSATESAPQSPVFEEPCIRKTMSPLSDNSDSGGGERVTQTVKTQFGQTSNEPYSLTTKPLLFKSISDDTPSLEPHSSLSVQPSEEFETDAYETLHNTIDVQFTQLERQEPDGEDNDNTSSTQYTDDYLRSLDGIKQRPLVREDGSGRRRAFKKRRSSGSSNSSYESRASREEELKMFTSLEEEELQAKKEGETDFTPIKYSSELLLKVKPPRRRHKRSPAKDAKPSDRSIRGSLEMLNEEANTNPWGEVAPEHYKDMPFWKHEKSISIDEEGFESELPAAEKEEERDVNARNLPTASAFEEATYTQNEEAINVLQRQKTKEEQENVNQHQPVSDEPARSDIQPNLQTKHNVAPNSAIDRKSASPRLRRSPRIDEIDQYEEMWNKANESITPQAATTPTTPTTPSITINRAPDDAPWRDQYGLLMEGISDFYDFTAMVNPSRSRSTSRQVSPASSHPSAPTPKNVECMSFQGINDTPVDIYDDTGNIVEVELTKEKVVNFIESLQNDCVKLSQTISDQLQNVADSPNVNEAEAGEGSRLEMSLLVQTMRVEQQSRSRSCSPLPTGDQLNRSVEIRRNELIKPNDKLFEALNLHISDNVNAAEQTLNICESPSSSTEEASMPANIGLLVEEQRTRSRSRSHSPLPTPNNLERSLETRRSRRIKQNDELIEKLGLDVNTSQTPSPTELHNEKSSESPESPESEYSKESMTLLVESLRVERTHSQSRSRSRSPLPTAENIRTGLEQRRKKRIQQNDELFQQLNASTSLDMKSTTTPIISIQGCDEEPANEKTVTGPEESDYSLEKMTSLVESLRLQRSRSKSPMRRLERERTPEPSNIRVGIIESDELSEGEDEHQRRSRTPSRSVSISPTRYREHSPQPSAETDFHVMLNLEASQNRTLFKCSEEMESLLAEKQRQVDAEALRKLSNASEEIELRTVTPVTPVTPTESEDKNKLGSMPFDERLRQLRCSPTTPDYDRTISQEWNDVQRIKDEMLASGFKRSTYVGESLDLGSEFAPLREQTAHFRRSRSPSPSLVATESLETADKRREVQDKILSELILASEQVADVERLGAKPKELRSLSKEIQETQYEELRRMNAEFQRSRSQSRSPLGEVEAKEVQQIEGEAKKREFEDKLHNIEKSDINFQAFSRYLNAGFLDNERRASDSALIQKPEVVIQLRELEEDFDVEPENYHHFRRFSLNQEQSIEEYPNDDYVFVSQIEVQTPKGTRTWIREDYYSEDFDQISLITEEMGGNAELAKDDVSEAMEEHIRVWEEEETDGSEDERQTVVEVEDEIDEDICDFNERGPADESHHEQSECEEAEREMDRYAGREANDWQHVDNIDELLADDILLAGEEEGAVGGGVSILDYDSDSVAIDEIYDEAIKNRKQSGILRDYDSILKDMQKNYLSNAGTTDGSEGDMSATSDNERKKGESKKEGKPRLKLIKNEHREHELRYLGDASVNERQSTRLRTRYGYMPQLHGSGVDDLDIEVDLSYKPKREYNWRKNFKIEDDEADTIKEEKPDPETNANLGEEKEHFDLRKFSLGGESITLFSQGAEGLCYEADENQLTPDTIQEEREYTNEVAEITELGAVGDQEELMEKPKKKKSKKKLRKESRNNSKEYYTKDEDDSENQIYSRRNSSIQMETASPKRTKSRSRRNSKNSSINDELSGSLFSPRSSVVAEEPLASFTQEGSVAAVAATKKKLKKRKKTKEVYGTTEADIKEELTMHSLYLDLTVNVPTASAAVSPAIADINPLATLSPQNSICTPTSSVDSETPELKELLSASSTEGSPTQRENQTTAVEARISAAADALLSATATAPEAVVTVATRTSTTPTATTKTSVDNFDILKDANFYPLF